jgi:hypothetical protein
MTVSGPAVASWARPSPMSIAVGVAAVWALGAWCYEPCPPGAR